MRVDLLKDSLAQAGLNLTAPIAVDRYDAIVAGPWRSSQVAPGCGSVLIVGNGGRDLWPQFERAPEFTLRRNPLDRYTERILRESVGHSDAAIGFSLYTDKRNDAYLPLIALAHAAGLGVPSRLGVLVHPKFGPWIALRSVIYLKDSMTIQPAAAFDPCPTCAAPCQTQCHGQAVGPITVDIERCFRTKILNVACRAACDARTACVVGPEHAYSTTQIAHHSRIRWRSSTLRHAAKVLLKPTSTS